MLSWQLAVHETANSKALGEGFKVYPLYMKLAVSCSAVQYVQCSAVQCSRQRLRYTACINVKYMAGAGATPPNEKEKRNSQFSPISLISLIFAYNFT